MNWWEWLIFGVGTGAVSWSAILTLVFLYMAKNASKYMPIIMRHVQQSMMKRAAKRANDASRVTTG